MEVEDFTNEKNKMFDLLNKVKNKRHPYSKSHPTSKTTQQEPKTQQKLSYTIKKSKNSNQTKKRTTSGQEEADSTAPQVLLNPAENPVDPLAVPLKKPVHSPKTTDIYRRTRRRNAFVRRQFETNRATFYR